MNNNINTCPSCHEEIDPASYFCFQCGKKLREKPLSTSIAKQILIYFISFFLSPLGLWWGFKYLRQKDIKAKRIGIIAIVLTVMAIILTIQMIKIVIDYTTQSVNLQLEQYRELGL